jgi:enoyl-CoA hydratase/carnithine racemase
MVGADISDFFPALDDVEEGFRVSSGWSRTARRLDEEFQTSVGVVNGKRCLGGMLELLMHCHYLVAVDDARLGMPEVTLPVVPGMEGCHWPFRRSRAEDWPRVLNILLSGEPVRAPDAVGWLVDYVGSLDEVLTMAWTMAAGASGAPPRRPLEAGMLKDVPREVPGLALTGGPAREAAVKAIVECVQGACAAPLSEALELQARHSADFMTGPACRKGEIGAQYTKTMIV